MAPESPVGPVSRTMPLVQTYPPLGQVTPLESGRVDLIATVESEENVPWDVILWSSIDGAAWTGSQLFPADAKSEPQCLQSHAASITRKQYYTVSLTFKESVQFTLKYRSGPETDWSWARDEQGIADGTMVVRAIEPLSVHLRDLVDLSPGWDVAGCLSQTPRTLLWSLQASISSTGLRTYDDADRGSVRDICIGTLKTPFLRWFALVRNSSPWLAPRQGKEHLYLDHDAIICAFLTLSGRYLVFLTLAGVDNVVSVLRSTQEGRLSVHARYDGVGGNDGQATVLVAEGDDLGCTISATMYHARDLAINTSEGIREEPNPSYPPDRAQPGPQSSEPWYDGLGYCTWNSLGQELTEGKILHALEELSKNNIDVSTLIIDDNWQNIDHRGNSQFDHGWLDFEADTQSFPRGLKATVTSIRQRYPNIQNIAVWHALLGYWGGISADGPLAERYKTVELSRQDPTLPINGRMSVVDAVDAPRLYDDFYQFLVDCGVDSVKTDAQFMVDTWTDPAARQELLYTYLDAWSNAALRHFSMRTISCMSLFPQWIFHMQSSPRKPTFPLRSSDDFTPGEPSAHPWHVWTNAHNCIVLQCLNVIPDWDMFQTGHEFGGFHAAARCISGGPVYITDVPGKHDTDIISQITGRSPSGNTTILRPSVIGKAVSPFVGYDDNAFLKVGSYNGASETGTSILGVFNVSGRPLTELVPLSDFPGTVSLARYVVRAHTTDAVSAPTSLSSPRSLFNITLGTRGFEILCAYPLQHMPSTRGPGTVSVANLGLVDKMTGCAAITSGTTHKQDNGRIRITTRLKALGVLGLGIYISCLPDLDIPRDFMITILKNPIPFETVTVSAANPHVLKVDLERAWGDMEMSKKGGREVDVMVHFSVR
ncbi:Raffinose synthase or seed imbibition protein Sip1 [Geosmithia morbida]|uniref:Raffinose synthase or seed imbibition protein Sip1 n=1 Tax=Geosmithia morbida TaxID=1094350 RepID=A0A9P4YZ05_9HYPO|nr:Raffinose synthase or seed imbibition protein Sip1 [Geosmithia morbida]KAF4125127.1 Raffinose synthase or seed imbibition protein Sip1 [Geosmithia morbida]